MTKALYRDTWRTVRRSFSRFVSIAAIVALGTSFFVGIKATGPDMLATAKSYFDDNDLMDVRVVSTIGLTDDDIASIASVSGVDHVMPEKFCDALVRVNGATENDIDGTQISTRAYSLDPDMLSEYVSGTYDGGFINKPTLIEGRYPTSAGECLVDASRLSTPSSYQLGNVISLEADSGDLSDTLSVTSFTIVGIIRTPYYLSFERGNTLVGSGKIGTFIYIPSEAFATDYYSEAYVTVKGADAYDPYSTAYEDYISKTVDDINSISAQCLASRVTSLSNSLPDTITKAQTEISNATSQAESQLDSLKSTIDTLTDLVNNGEQKISDAQSAFDTKFGALETELNNSSADYQAAVAEYTKNYNTYTENKAEYDKQYAQWQTSSAEYNTKQSDYVTKSAQAKSAQSSLDATQSLIDQSTSVLNQLSAIQSSSMNNDQISSVLNVIQSLYPDLYTSIKGLTATGMVEAAVTAIKPILESYQTQLASQQKTLNESNVALTQAKSELDAASDKLAASKTALDTKKAELDSAQTELNNVAKQLTDTNSSLSSSNLQLAIEKVKAEADLNNLKTEVANAPSNLAKAQASYDSGKKELDDKLATVRAELKKAEDTYESLPTATWHVYDRSDTPGYTSFGNTTKNMNTLANIFPVFFFLVAAFVCLSTMNRMVEEDRLAIGTYRALGYSKPAIASKYLIYSLTAGLTGALIGIAGGIFLFPWAISSAFSIMYTLPALKFTFPWLWAVVGLVISILCTVGAALYACVRELRSVPASLMRNKAPKPGKRVLLEHIGFIWKHMSFSAKVTARNLFRNKQRLFMTVLGIGGCTALLLASMGTYNSVSAIMNKQFGSDAIDMYDFQLVFSSAEDPEKPSDDYKTVLNDDRISSLMLTSEKSVTGWSSRSSKKMDVYLFVPQDNDALNIFIDLRERKTGNVDKLTDNGALITEKFARDTDTAVGDSVNVTMSDGSVYSIPVAGIVENYTFHYIYLSQSLYTQIFGAAPSFNYAMGKLSDSVTMSADSQKQKGQMATDLMKLDTVNAVSYTSDTVESFDEIIRIVSIVVIIFIAAAAVLAFVILYNLANVNLRERYRELASLKVLGFSDREVSRYIYRENVFMSIFGIVAGMFMGIGLHSLIIKYAEIDTVMFGRSISLASYIISGAMTILFTLIIDMVMHVKLKKVDMVTSLKSVE